MVSNHRTGRPEGQDPAGFREDSRRRASGRARTGVAIRRGEPLGGRGNETKQGGAAEGQAELQSRLLRARQRRGNLREPVPEGLVQQSSISRTTRSETRAGAEVSMPSVQTLGSPGRFPLSQRAGGGGRTGSWPASDRDRPAEGRGCRKGCSHSGPWRSSRRSRRPEMSAVAGGPADGLRIVGAFMTDGHAEPEGPAASRWRPARGVDALFGGIDWHLVLESRPGPLGVEDERGGV